MDPRVFSPKALDLIFEYSQGIPRLINIVCDNALISGYASDRQIIDQKTIQEIIFSREGKVSKKNRTWVIWMIVLAVIALLVVLLGWDWFKNHKLFNIY